MKFKNIHTGEIKDLTETELFNMMDSDDWIKEKDPKPKSKPKNKKKKSKKK